MLIHVCFFFHIIFFSGPFRSKNKPSSWSFFSRPWHIMLFAFAVIFLSSGWIKKSGNEFSDSPYLFLLWHLNCVLLVVLSLATYTYLIYITMYLSLYTLELYFYSRWNENNKKKLFFMNIKVKLLQWTHTMRISPLHERCCNINFYISLDL